MQPKPTITTTAEIISNKNPTPEIFMLTLQPVAPFHHQPGQFLLLSAQKEDGNTVERAYSIACAPREDHLIELIIKKTPNGQMGQLLPTFKEGKELVVKAPYGHFGKITPEQSADGIIFIGAGVGIAPLRAIIQGQTRREEHPPLSLFYGFRTEEDYHYRKEFESYLSQGSLSQLHIAMSQPLPEWAGYKGHVSDLIKTELTPSQNKAIYICGPPSMVDETKKNLLDMGFEKKQIHLEAW